MDIIGKTHPPLSKGHNYIYIAMSYFTKQVKTIPFQSINEEIVIKFIKEYIIHKFLLPKTITTNLLLVFTRENVKQFAQEYKLNKTNFDHEHSNLIK